MNSLPHLRRPHLRVVALSAVLLLAGCGRESTARPNPVAPVAETAPDIDQGLADIDRTLADIDRALADMDQQIADADRDVATPEGDLP